MQVQGNSPVHAIHLLEKELQTIAELIIGFLGVEMVTITALQQ
jgi:hypothetical protein